jgi:hypothetical protein
MTENRPSNLMKLGQTLLFGGVVAVLTIFGKRIRPNTPEEVVGSEGGAPVRRTRPPATAMLMFLVALLIAVAAGAKVRSLNPGPEQPIPFSHRIHVSTKNLNCFFCHPNAANSSQPGMPPVEKCLLCHNVIAPKFTPISKIHDYNNKGRGIPWKRVNQVPDFVHFSHQPHLARGFDCSLCHGNVKEMDRISQAHVFNMDFCVTCHKANNASVSCVTCHY